MQHIETFAEADNSEYAKLSVATTVVGSIIPFSQLFIRIFKMEGSLDKPWLLIPIFDIPPFSLVFTLMGYFGKLKKGKGGNPLDWFLLPILIVNIATVVLVDMFIENTYLAMALKILIPLILSSILAYVRDIFKCQKATKTIAKNPLKSIGSVLLPQTIATLLTGIISTILPIAFKFVPVIGQMFWVISMFASMFLPQIGTIFYYITHTLLYGLSYILTNMFNATDIAGYCSGSMGIAGIVVGVVGLVLLCCFEAVRAIGLI